MARGDERVGELILEAHTRGARLDAWEEHFDRDLWRSVIEDADWPVIEECCGERKTESPLPWDDISIRVSKSAHIREYEKALRSETTSACIEDCTNPCGSCGDEVRIEKNSLHGEAVQTPEEKTVETRKTEGRLLLQYSKTGIASYLQHLSIVDAFDRAILMSGIDVVYSEGFNPMPRFETTQPLPIAVESDCEIASMLLYSEADPAECMNKLNLRLPSGLRIEAAAYFPMVGGKKQRTIGSLEWGSIFRISKNSEQDMEAPMKKLEALIESLSLAGFQLFRDSESSYSLRMPLAKKREYGLLRLLERCIDATAPQGVFMVTRIASLADPGDGSPVSFFRAYEIVS